MDDITRFENVQKRTIKNVAYNERLGILGPPVKTQVSNLPFSPFDIKEVYKLLIGLYDKRLMSDLLEMHDKRPYNETEEAANVA